MARRTLCVVSLIILASAVTAFSQCGEPTNLMTGDNCSFDATLGDWFASNFNFILPDGGTVVHSAVGGRTSPGAMVGTPYPDMPPPMGWGYVQGIEICLNTAVPQNDVLGFGIYAYANFPTGGTMSVCEVSVMTSSLADCDEAGFLDQAFDQNSALPSDAWGKVNDGDITLTAASAGAQSVRMRVYCSSGNNFSIVWDDAYLGVSLVPVELQSFSIE